MSNKPNTRKHRKQVGLSQSMSMKEPRPGELSGAMSNNKHAINAYICKSCGKLTVVWHRDSGVTPMFLGCRNPACDSPELATSAGYPSPPVPKKVMDAVAFEWYRPGWDEYNKLEPPVKDHVLRGGLLLREIEREEDELSD